MPQSEKTWDGDRMLRLPEVIDITGRSGTAIWRDERRGTFPMRIKIGSRAVAWRLSEVIEWLEERERASSEPPVQESDVPDGDIDHGKDGQDDVAPPWDHPHQSESDVDAHCKTALSSPKGGHHE